MSLFWVCGRCGSFFCLVICQKFFTPVFWRPPMSGTRDICPPVTSLPRYALKTTASISTKIYSTIKTKSHRGLCSGANFAIYDCLVLQCCKQDASYQHPLEKGNVVSLASSAMVAKRWSVAMSCALCYGSMSNGLKICLLAIKIRTITIAYTTVY